MKKYYTFVSLYQNQLTTRMRNYVEIISMPEDKEKLIVDLPIELSQLLNNLLTLGGDTNTLKAEVIGRRK